MSHSFVSFRFIRHNSWGQYEKQKNKYINRYAGIPSFIFFFLFDRGQGAYLSQRLTHDEGGRPLPLARRTPAWINTLLVKGKTQISWRGITGIYLRNRGWERSVRMYWSLVDMLVSVRTENRERRCLFRFVAKNHGGMFIRRRCEYRYFQYRCQKANSHSLPSRVSIRHNWNFGRNHA